MAIDPVCRMIVNEKTATLTSEYKGKKYCLCAPGCKRAFMRRPRSTWAAADEGQGASRIIYFII